MARPFFAHFVLELSPKLIRLDDLSVKYFYWLVDADHLPIK